MTFPIARRDKQYLKTARTLLRVAKTMTDEAVARQLKALADDYQRRAEKALYVDVTRALAASVASTGRCTTSTRQLNRNDELETGQHDLKDNVGKIIGTVYIDHSGEPI